MSPRDVLSFGRLLLDLFRAIFGKGDLPPKVEVENIPSEPPT